MVPKPDVPGLPVFSLRLLFSYSNSAILLLKLAGSFMFRSFYKNAPTLDDSPLTVPAALNPPPIDA